MNRHDVDKHEEELIKKNLFIGEADTLKKKESLLQVLGQHAKIVEETGLVEFEDTVNSDEQRVFFACALKYFYAKVRKDQKESITTEELRFSLKKPLTAFSGRLTNLIKQNYVGRLDSGRYRVNPHNIEKYLNKIKKPRK